MNLPNALTLGRIFLVPLLVVVLLTKFEGRMIFGVPKEFVGAAIFGLASFTDWLDGYLARRRKQVTVLGKFKMAAEVTAILALILGRDHLQQFFILGTIALWVAMITAVASGMDYY